MTKTFPLGRHELRVFAIDPVLVHVRFDGDFLADEARALVQFLSPEIAGRRSRFLVSAENLGSLCLDSRRELTIGKGDSAPKSGLVADIILVGASMLHKVVLSQIVSAAAQHQEFSGQTHFFDSLDDALAWMNVPASLLG